MFMEHTYPGERGSVSTGLLLTETPTVSNLVLISFALLLALVLAVTDCGADHYQRQSWQRRRLSALADDKLHISPGLDGDRRQ